MLKIFIFAISVAHAQMPPRPPQLFRLHDAINQACGCQILRMDTHNDLWPKLDDYTIDFPPGVTADQQAAGLMILKTWFPVVPPGGQ